MNAPGRVVEHSEILNGTAADDHLPTVQRIEEPEPGDFDWSTDESVAIQEQRKTAIYLNTVGQAVIRQEAVYPYEQNDSFVVFSLENLPGLIRRLQILLDESGEGAA